VVQRCLVEDDHMIQALAAYRADDALDVSSLPGRTGRRKHFLDAHIPDLLHEIIPENPIPIPQEITRCRVPGKRIAELLSGPFGRWMRRYAEVENPAPVVCQNKEHVQDLKPDGGHGEEVDRDQALEMVDQKRPPSLSLRAGGPRNFMKMAPSCAEWKRRGAARLTSQWISRGCKSV
jgi:hypothetical protein